LKRVVLIALTLAACGGSGNSHPFDLSASVDLAGFDGAECEGDYLNSDAGDACPLGCSAAVQAVPDEGRVHVAYGTPVAYVHNPPASGPHWPSPAPWGVHPELLAKEYWVHNLEHGGVVLLYNCPGGDGGAVNACPNEIALLTAIMQAQRPDKYNEVRMVLTQDPDLPTRFAAVAWDWAWTGDAIDPAAIQCFINARYGRGPEDIP
jgi:hypothetical protein